MYQPTSLETEMEIRRLCADFIGWPWSSAEVKDVTIERLGGFVNRNFAVTLKSDANNIAEQNGVPAEVMVHLYGNELIDSETGFKLNGEAAEAVIVNQLSELGLAPNILGVFPGGRIEKFIPGRILALNDLNNPNLMNEMGQKLARIHSLCIPIRKAPDRLEGLLQNVQNRSVLVEFGNASEEQKVHYNNFLNFPLEKEIRQISALLSSIGGKPVFIHGDFSMNNIILYDEATTVEPKLMFVDFELSSYYYRSYDFAYPFKYLELATARNTGNQMNGTGMDNNNVELLKELMINSYLREWKVLNNNDGKTYELSEDDNVQHIKMEVDIARFALDLVKLCYMRFKKAIIRDPETFKPICEFIDEYYKRKENVLLEYKDRI